MTFLNRLLKRKDELNEKDLAPFAFAEVLVERAKGASLATGTKLVFYELLRLHGDKIDLATDENCYIEALAMFYVALSTSSEEAFRGALITPRQELTGVFLKHRIGNLSFEELMPPEIQVMTIPESVMHTRIASIGEHLRHPRLLLALTDDDLKFLANYANLPEVLWSMPRAVARFGQLEVRSHQSLLEACRVYDWWKWSRPGLQESQ